MVIASASEPTDVLAFWFDDALAAGSALERRYRVWFSADPEFDELVRVRFGAALAALARGELDHWQREARGRLAWIIVADQFSRNVHRGTARAYDLDAAALACCLSGMRLGHDAELGPVEKLFFYLPLQHAEDRETQRLSVARSEALMHDLPRELERFFRESLRYAYQHRDIVERFGRFPHRNAVLGRASTPEEQAYLADGAPRFGQGTTGRSERLREIGSARQHAGDPPRRWFSCADADLYVWYEDDDCMAFEFCYGKPHGERSVRWRRGAARRHARIDDGESSPLENRTPIALADEDFHAPTVALEFERVAADIEPRIFRLVLTELYR